MRSYPGLEKVTIQDHGGNWWRHGSLNADREWSLDYTNRIIAGVREDRLREKEEGEPVRCPQCGRILTRPNCPCGYMVNPKVKRRPVVQVDGQLIEMPGDIFKKRRIYRGADAARLWRNMYYRALHRKWDATFRQAEALFAVETGFWPSHELPLMPTDPMDWYRKVGSVPLESLNPEKKEFSNAERPMGSKSSP